MPAAAKRPRLDGAGPPKRAGSGAGAADKCCDHPATSSGRRRCAQCGQAGPHLLRLRIYGDSNAVGYRKGSIGTRGFLEHVLQRIFDVPNALGRTRLTVLPSSTEFLPWAQAREGGEVCVQTDYALLVLGTNDVTYLRGRAMQWSQDPSDAQIEREIRRSLRKILLWLQTRTRRRIFVLEPLNEMKRKVGVKDLVMKAMRTEVLRSGTHVEWLPMRWSEKDLQRTRGGVDPRHFSRGACRRIAARIKARLLPKR
mmetsp:Transcript_87755/g.171638  ORF Transcript_87755/g.171638 Transcript_87755/m.171638 type:complete len:254 (-) Transcript_87755:78-839(-)